MKLFDVYPRYSVNITRGEGNYVFDDQGQKYLDFYGGHAVVSIGHSHPHYVNRIQSQLNQLGFYSNSILMPIQEELASLLGQVSGLDEYQLFLVNSGAEANENALKIASFHNQRTKVIAFEKGFHGRTSAAVQCTDNAKIIAPINKGYDVITLPLNDISKLEEAVDDTISAIIIEGVQGIGGIYPAEPLFLQRCKQLCEAHNIVLILDEIQSGYGRTGDFFAFQQDPNLQPDLITMAKGMGNGFPIGGVLIHPKFEASYGLLGTTFGGNHLACAAGLAVLEVMNKENLIQKAKNMGDQLIQALADFTQITEIRGRGLMIALDFEDPISDLRKSLIFEDRIFTGSAKSPNTMRLLPPLSIGEAEIELFINALKKRIT